MKVELVKPSDTVITIEPLGEYSMLVQEITPADDTLRLSGPDSLVNVMLSPFLSVALMVNNSATDSPTVTCVNRTLYLTYTVIAAEKL